MQVDFLITERNAAVPDVVIPKLSHGNTVAEVVTGEELFENTDGIWTKNRSLKLGVSTADCAPICFADKDKIGIAHVGWRGLCLGLIENMIAQFDDSQLEALVGPHLHTFEIQKDDCHEQINRKFGDLFIKKDGDTMTFQFTDAILSLLPDETRVDDRNTETDHSLPSYRHGHNEMRLVTAVSFQD